MHKSKLIRLLKTLNPDEFKDFPKFIKSPFFSTNKKYILFYTYLSKYYPDFNSPKLTKELGFKKLFSGKPYNYHVIGNLMSGFATLTEEYVLNIQFQKESFNKKKTLARAYSERKDCYDLFQKYNASLIKEVEERTIRDRMYYEDLRILHHDFFFHPISDRQQIGTANLQQAMDYLDLSYIETKLIYLLEIKNRQHLINEEYSCLLKENIIRKEVQSFEQEKPIFSIYLKLLQLQEQTQDEKIFEKTKALFIQHSLIIGKEEKNIILLHLLNYCIRLIKKKGKVYMLKCLELYKIGLSLDVFISENRIMEVTFSNIVTAGAHCREFDWTKNFILEYKPFLDKEEREDTTILSLASLSFAQEKYAAVHQLLMGHSFDKPLHNIKSKVLLIRTYFEQFLKDDSYYDLVMAQTYAFEKFIRRHKIVSIEKADSFLNFIQFTRHITNGILDHNFPKNLISNITSTPALYYRDWLLQKIQDKMKK